MVEKIKQIVRSDARHTSQLIADMVGIAKVSVLRILRNILKLKKTSASWVPLLLTEERKRTHVKTAR